MSNERLTEFAQWINDLTKIGDREGLTYDEQATLAEFRHALNNSLNALTDIFAAHDALRLGLPWNKPYDPSGADLLCVALSAAFGIGHRVLPNPIIERIEHEAKRSSAARATAARLETSKLIDGLIEDLGKAKWERLPSRSDNSFAEDIIGVLNESLKKNELPEMGVDAVRKRINRIRTNGRSSG